MVDAFPSAGQLYAVPARPLTSATDEFTPDERRALTPYFTNLDSPVFALTNLPEVVKGALFARYSRSAKSVRRLFLDEFLGNLPVRVTPESSVGVERAEKLYERVLSEYGDDSVAQLGGAHIGCEGVSNVLTKVLERGRLMAYLEQSTRYVPYTDRPAGRWKFDVPSELEAGFAQGPIRQVPRRRLRYLRALAGADAGLLSHALPEDTRRYRRRVPDGHSGQGARHPARPAAGRDAIERRDLWFGTGVRSAAPQDAITPARRGARLRRPDACGAAHGDSRVSRSASIDPTAAGRWSKYLAERKADTDTVAKQLLGRVEAEGRPDVVLTDYDPDGELKVAAAALYASSQLPEDQLLAIARRMNAAERATVLHGVRRRPFESPAQAGTRVRAHSLLVRHPGRLRRLP